MSALWIPTSLEEFEKVDFSAMLDSKLMREGGIWIGCELFSLKFFNFRLEICRYDPRIKRNKLDFFKGTNDHKKPLGVKYCWHLWRPFTKRQYTQTQFEEGTGEVNNIWVSVFL